MLDFDVDIDDLHDDKKDLNSMLPKLARRLSAKKTVRTHSDGTIHSTINPAANPESPRSPRSPGGPNARRRNTRVGANGSICYAANELPADLRSLREQDIYNDPDSAADRALQAVQQMAKEAVEEMENAGAPNGATRRATLVPPPQAPLVAKVEGREVQQDHAQYALTYGMMLGIRVTTGRRDNSARQRASTASSGGSMRDTFNNSPSFSGSNTSFSAAAAAVFEERELLPDDFQQTTKLLLRPEGNSGPPFPTPPHKLPFAFGFKDYMPQVFRALRALSNIDEADYMTSLAGDFNYIEFLANSKSGCFFFYSHDGRFMIKTQSREEARLLRDMMPQYVAHLAERPDSLLARFYGLHRVSMPTLKRQTFFVVMQSVFYCPLTPPLTLHTKFDLKGSTVGRRTSAEDCAQGAVQKDLNFLEDKHRLRFDPQTLRVFEETLRADTAFLRDLNIMDYSLLLGVHDPEAEAERLQREKAQMLRGDTNAANMRRRSSGGVILAKKRNTLKPRNETEVNTATNSGNNSNNNSNNTTLDASSALPPSLFQQHDGGVLSSDESGAIYFMGIIDILQVYNTNKRLENFFKGFSHDRKQLSAVDPTLYAERMLQFLMAATQDNDGDNKASNNGNGSSNGNGSKRR